MLNLWEGSGGWICRLLPGQVYQCPETLRHHLVHRLPLHRFQLFAGETFKKSLSMVAYYKAIVRVFLM